MKTKNLLMLLAIAGIMVFASCKKEYLFPTLTKEEATAALTEIGTDYNSITTEFATSEAVLMQNALQEIGKPFDGAPLKSPSNSKSFKSNYLRTIKPSLTKNYSQEGLFVDFDFEGNVGTWTYNGQTWGFTPTPSDKIVIVFPYKTGTATLTYYEYQTKTFDSEPYLSHLKFKAELTGHTTPIYSWEYTASHSDLTASLSFNYTFGVFSQSESISFTADGKLSSFSLNLVFDFTFKKDGNVIFAENAEVVVVGSGDVISSVKMDISITIMNIVIKYEINVDKNVSENSNPSDFMTISVWTTEGAKVADVIFKQENNDYIAYFKYSDGTEEEVSDKLGDVNDKDSLAYKLENIMPDLMYLMMNSY